MEPLIVTVAGMSSIINVDNIAIMVPDERDLTKTVVYFNGLDGFIIDESIADLAMKIAESEYDTTPSYIGE